MNLKKIMLVLLAILLLLATELASQGMSARIVGTVHNEDGLPLGGILVTAVNIGNNSASTTVSGKQDGSFRLLGLAPGIYQVSFDLEGYESYTAAGISLSVEQSVTLRIKLKKTAPPDGQGVVAAEAGAREREDRRDKRDFFAERAKWSLRISFGMNYIALGDSNAFLRGFTDASSSRATASKRCTRAASGPPKRATASRRAWSSPSGWTW